MPGGTRREPRLLVALALEHVPDEVFSLFRHRDVDRGRLADPRDQAARGQVVEKELERLRLLARLVAARDVERVAGRVQRVAVRRLGIALAQEILVALVAEG